MDPPSSSMVEDIFMARIARVVVPGVPHHVVQRGVRKMNVFFGHKDKVLYLNILRYQALRFGLQIWSYCLMDNHVHLVVVPETKESLAQAIGQTHRYYTCHINLREGWKGYLWQGRFYSYPLDEAYLYAAVRYVERNPVTAGIVKSAEDYSWSSAPAHTRNLYDPVLSDFFLTSQISNWSKFLKGESPVNKKIERHLQTGRPLGDEDFVSRLEMSLGRILRKNQDRRKISMGTHN